MKRIIETALVTYYDYIEFYNKLNDNINSMQSKGLEVEIQYNHTSRGINNEGALYTALIVGRSEAQA